MKKLALVFFCLLLFSNFASAATIAQLNTSMDTEVKAFVANMLTSSGDIYKFITAIAKFLLFIVVVKNLTRFIFTGEADWYELGFSMMFFLLVWSYTKYYYTFTYDVKYAFDDLSKQMIMLATGESSYSSTWFLDMITLIAKKALHAPSVGVFESIMIWISWAIFGIIQMLLMFVFYFAKLYIMLGFAFTQIIGVLFLPFLVAPFTRGLFDQWLKMFLGWGITAIFMNAAQLVSLISYAAYVNSLAAKTIIHLSNSKVTGTIVLKSGDMDSVWELICICLVLILFVFETFKLAATVTNGINCAGASSGAVGLVSGGIGKFIGYKRTMKYFGRLSKNKRFK